MGREGDDWKCRSVAGRLNAGVGGTAAVTSWGGALLLPGVSSVRPLGFLFGGEGGLTKAGDANERSSYVDICFSFEGRKGRLVVDAARGFRSVLTASPLRFRPFLLGGGCFASSKKGDVDVLSAEVRGRSMLENDDGGGDSGDDPGDGSVALESSTVEAVVVGEESVEPDVAVESDTV